MMNYKNALRFVISTAAIAGAMSLVALTVNAQDKSDARDSAPARKSGRDPFTKYQPIVKMPKGAPAKKIGRAHV